MYKNTKIVTWDCVRFRPRGRQGFLGTLWPRVLLALLVLLLSGPAFAQILPDGFNPNANGTVHGIVVQGDGKILIGGEFTKLGSVTRSCIARLNADGSLDTSFNPAANNTIHSLVVQPDGKILIGGAFTKVGSVTRNRIARLNADGSLDTAFNPAANDAVLDMAVQSDGKILVGGQFTAIAGGSRPYVVRLEANGALDSTYNVPVPDGQIDCLALQADGQLVICGQFTKIGASARSRIARLKSNGTLDAGFDLGANSFVSSLAVQADGKVLVGGVFSEIGGVPRSTIARFNANGQIDTGFNPGANGDLTTIVPRPDGKIMLGGSFTTVAGAARNRIARLNSNGTIDADFNFDFNGVVYSLAIQPNGNAVVGGKFTQVSGQVRNRLARLQSDSALDTGFNSSVADAVHSIALQSDGKVVAGSIHTISRLNADGTRDTQFTQSNLGFPLNSLAIQSDGKVLVGGGGASSGAVHRYNANGTRDSSFNASVNGMVRAVLVQADGKVVIGGDFSTVNGQARQRLARLKTDGSIDPDFSTELGATQSVYSLALQPSGKILVSAKSIVVNGNSYIGVARLNTNGTRDITFFIANANAPVTTIVPLPDGRVLVGGEFTQIGKFPRGNIALLTDVGIVDMDYRPNANGTVRSMVLQPDERILVGGDFTQIVGQPRSRIARLNADGTLDTRVDIAADAGVLSMAVQGNGKVLIGGSFSRIDGRARAGLVRVAVPDAAVQTLAVGADRASVRWMRSGSGPELHDVGFESSSNGTAWSALGRATRIAGGWSLGGLSLPRNQDIWLRARGKASTTGNGSSSLIELVQTLRVTVPVVTATVTSGQGNVTPATQNVEPGQAAQVTVAPTSGWRVDSVAGSTCTPVDQGGGVWRVANVQATCAIAVTFAQILRPTATSQSVDLDFNTPKLITLTGNDANPGGPHAFTFAVVVQPAHGSIGGFNDATGVLTYTPTTGYWGFDTFMFTAATANGVSTPVMVYLTIAAGQPVIATPQNVQVSFNTAQTITLAGSDPNPGGPFAFTFALADAPAHGTIDGFDVDTGAVIYTPASGYVGSDSFTFTASTVNGTSQAATVSLSVSKPQLALAIDDGRDDARYGYVVDYSVTLTNTGFAANKVPVVFTLSAGLDGDQAEITCTGVGNGAACEQDATDPLRFIVTLPVNHTLTWLASVPVHEDAAGDSVEFGVAATGATPVTDNNTLVLLRDGFDRFHTARSVRLIEGEAAKEILDSDALIEVEVPEVSSQITALAVIREGAREVRVESRSVADAVVVRLLGRTADGRERATAWKATQAGAVLVLGSVAVEGASGLVGSRALVLAGADSPIELH